MVFHESQEDCKEEKIKDISDIQIKNKDFNKNPCFFAFKLYFSINSFER